MIALPLPLNPRVVSVGDFVADLVCAIPSLPVEAGKHQLADSITVEPGGSGNFAVAARRLGLQVSMLGVRGADSFGDLAAQALEAEAVDISGLLRQQGGSTTTVIVLADTSGRHVFLGKYGSGSVVAVVPAWLERIESAAALFLSGYSLHEDRLCQAAVSCIEFASTRNIPTFFDPGPHVRGLSPELIDSVVGLSSVILLTEDEIPLILPGKKGVGDCRALLERGPAMICVKRGAQGCTILTREGETSHPGFQVEARDTNAAGDSFAAAFIYGFLNGWPPLALATFANAMGAAKVKKIGSGTRVPTADEVLSVLQDNHDFIQFLSR
jgi:ribokinase